MIAVWLRLISLIFQWEEQDTTCYQMPMPSHWSRYHPPPPKLASPCAVDSNILIIASVDTNLCQLLRQLKENDEQPFEKCQQLRTAMCCYSPLICPFHPSKVHMAKNGWRYSYTLHWNIIVPIISVNPVSNRQLVQRRYQVGKAPCSRQLRRRKIWGFYKIGWSNGACNLWSTFK